MAITINAQFNQFVKFAQEQYLAGRTKAIARDGGEVLIGGALAGHCIKPAVGDKLRPLWRSQTNKDANNAVRTLFMQSVADIFGGEARIPQSVKTAMLMKDYNCGKPLTARRIIAVKAAISAEIDKLNSEKAAAKAMGFSSDEVNKMVTVAGLYAEATGCTDVEAFKEVARVGSKANRLMNYGGRFLESAENFGHGLRLLDTFKEWFTNVREELNSIGLLGKRKEGWGVTLLNAASGSFSETSLIGTEKFIFEYLAHNPNANLAETNGERMFGLETNAAMRLFGCGYNNGCTQTIAQIPPAKRLTLYAAIDLFYPLVTTAAEANKRPKDCGALSGSDSVLIIGRVLKHFDEIEAMKNGGTLTTKNLIRLCFPELPVDSKCEVADVVRLIAQIENSLLEDAASGRFPGELIVTIQAIQRESGCTYDEAVELAVSGKSPPIVPYVSSGTLNVSAYDGTTNSARIQLETDLDRPTNYSDVKSKTMLLDNEDDIKFTFNFPGEQPLSTNGTEEGRANVRVVIDKIEAFCGNAHPAQASGVMTMVSQSGLGILRGGLSSYGIGSNEHSACDFTLSKNAQTGDVTIKYTSPKVLPFSFEWTATVRPDGFVTTTPLQFERGQPPAV